MQLHPTSRFLLVIIINWEYSGVAKNKIKGSGNDMKIYLHAIVQQFVASCPVLTFTSLMQRTFNKFTFRCDSHNNSIGSHTQKFSIIYKLSWLYCFNLKNASTNGRFHSQQIQSIWVSHLDNRNAIYVHFIDREI
jgi:hypothetical protein